MVLIGSHAGHGWKKAKEIDNSLYGCSFLLFMISIEGHFWWEFFYFVKVSWLPKRNGIVWASPCSSLAFVETNPQPGISKGGSGMI